MGNHPKRAVAVALTRIVVGLFFVLAGQPKLTDPAHWAGNFRHWHVPLPSVAAVLVGALEVGGGALLALGIAPRLVSALFVVDMLGAALFAGATDGPAYVVLPAILGSATAVYARWGGGAWQAFPDRRLRHAGPAARVRHGLVAGAALTAALMALGLARYPGLLTSDPAVFGFLGALAAGLTAVVVAAVLATRLRTPEARGAMADGCRWGLVFGALWVVEMGVANLGYGLGRWTLVPYFGAIWAVVALTVVAGAVGARRYGRIRAGVLVGAWSGSVSGLVGLATMQALALTAMPVLRDDPQNRAEFAGAGDLSTAIAGDYLAAGITHLVIVGLVGGTALAALGAVLGATIDGPMWRVSRPAGR